VRNAPTERTGDPGIECSGSETALASGISMKTSRVRKIAAILIGVITFAFGVYYVMANFQWGAMIEVLKGANPYWLIIGGTASVVVFWFMRTLRWDVLLKSQGTQVRFLNLYLCTAVSLAFSTITPLQSGETLKVEWLRKQGLLDRVEGYGTFAVERLIDACVIASLTAVGASGTLRIWIGWKIVPWLLGTITIAFLICTAAARLQVIRDAFGKLLTQFILYTQNPRELFTSVVLSLGAWGAAVLGWQATLHSITIDISFQESCALMVSGLIISLMSCVPGSIGVAEAGMTELLIRLHQEAAIAQAGAIALRIYSLLGLVLGGAHLLILKKYSARITASGQVRSRSLGPIPINVSDERKRE